MHATERTLPGVLLRNPRSAQLACCSVDVQLGPELRAMPSVCTSQLRNQRSVNVRRAAHLQRSSDGHLGRCVDLTCLPGELTREGFESNAPRSAATQQLSS